MNILLCAYACNPDKFSEHHVGWSVLTRLSQLAPDHFFYVVTRLKNKPAIEEQAAFKNVEFIYFDLPLWVQRLKSRFGLVRLYYYFWSIFGGWFLLRYFASSKKRLDVIHHLTFVCDWLPSIGWMMAKQCDFIFGPVGTNDYSAIEGQSKWLLLVDESKVAMRRWDVFTRLTIARSKFIYVNNETSLRFFQKSQADCELFPAIGTSVSTEAPVRTERGTAGFRICFVGRLIEIKRLFIFLRVFEELCTRHDDVEGVIIGDGPDRARLEQFLSSSPFAGRIVWEKSLSHSECLEQIAMSDILLFTSFEAAGLPLIEAAAAGVCTLSSNVGLFSSVFGRHDFALFEEQGASEMTRQICAKVDILYWDRAYLNELGNRNKDLSKKFDWEQKAEEYLNRYRLIGREC